MILIVEDQKDVNAMLAQILKQAGYQIQSEYTGTDAINAIKTKEFELVLLDIMLPYKSGDEVLREMRTFTDTPVIVISAKDMVGTKIDLLKLGADDYITKPFGTSELLARIRTAVRHLSGANGQGNQTHTFEAHGLVIDFDRRRIFVHDQEVHLTQVEYKIVSMLAKNSGKVITYDTLISHVWGPYADDNNRILRVNMANIRRKLEQNPAQPEYIFTEIGIGYRMIDAD